MRKNLPKGLIAKLRTVFRGRRLKNLRVKVNFGGGAKFLVIDTAAKGKARNVISLQKGHKEMIQTPMGHLPGGHKTHIELRTGRGEKLTLPEDGRVYLDPPHQGVPIKGKDY